MREPSDRRSLDRTIEAFVLDCRARRLSPRTIEFYLEGLNALRRQLPPPRDAQTLAMVDLDVARALAADLVARVAASTAAGRIRAVKVFSRWCTKEGYLRHDPLERLATAPPRPGVTPGIASLSRDGLRTLAAVP